jgi:MoaA/NifB/PqqE/SkfB family radical SAM enzyme
MRVDWHLTNRCNFYCNYCHPQIRKVLNDGIQESSHAAISDAFDKLADECEILMSGGEPFAFPDFSELCVRLAKRHKISINTNLSLTDEVDKFSRLVTPDRVLEIIAAIHIEERERLGHSLEQFAKNYHLLRIAGFKISALYVMFPPLITRSIHDFERLSKLGINNIQAKVFKGAFRGVRYPDGYTQADREVIFQLSGSYPNNEDYMQGQMNFKGRECAAGRLSVKVNINGSIQRCATVKIPMGNLFNNEIELYSMDRPCTAHRVLALSECKQLLKPVIQIFKQTK